MLMSPGFPIWQQELTAHEEGRWGVGEDGEEILVRRRRRKLVEGERRKKLVEEEMSRREKYGKKRWEEENMETKEKVW